MHSYNVFDFLKEVVSKVPDYGHSDSAADVSKRRYVVFGFSLLLQMPKVITDMICCCVARKVVAGESKDCDEESKRNIVVRFALIIYLGSYNIVCNGVLSLLFILNLIHALSFLLN